MIVQKREMTLREMLTDRSPPAVMQHTDRRASATQQFYDGTGGRPQSAELLRCCHCEQLWKVEPGSGRKRGWCYRCQDVTCGAGTCVDCRPFKKKLEAMRRRAELHTAAQRSLHG